MPTPTPPPVIIIPIDEIFDSIPSDDITWEDIDYPEFDDIILDEEWEPDELPETEEEFDEEIELLDNEEDILDIEEDEYIPLEIDDVPEDYRDEYEEGPPDDENIYFDEETGEWEDDPDLELEDVEIDDLLDNYRDEYEEGPPDDENIYFT